MRTSPPERVLNDHVGALLWLVRDYLTWASIGRTLTRQFKRWMALRSADLDPLHIVSDDMMEREKSIYSAHCFESRDVFRRMCEVLKSERESEIELDPEERELMDLWRHWSELKRRKADRDPALDEEELQAIYEELHRARVAAEAAYLRMASQYGLEVP